MADGRGKGPSRFWLNDEEMAKKDDDLNKPGHSKKKSHPLSLPRVAQPGSWQAAAPRAPRKSQILKLLIYVCIGFLAMLGVLRMFSTPDRGRYLGEQGPGLGRIPHSPPLTAHDAPLPPARAPAPIPNGYNDRSKAKYVSGSARNYNGLLRFPELAVSLQAIDFTDGTLEANRNVLFAAASTSSISTLLPLACRMAVEKKNYVHFAFLPNSEVPISELLKINGIDTNKCPLILHDARPDMVAVSTDLRMARASSRAMYHVGMYMHPQAILIDSTAAEEHWFAAGVRDQLRSQRAALIELPERPHLRLGWLATLDAASLAEWNRVTFDIIVNAPSSGSESIRRLLTSLARADLSSVGIPHLTVELPSVIDQALEDFLNKFSWPQGHRFTSQPSLLTIRRRVPRAKLNVEESAARFLESFWPANPTSNHVLILSPNVEISPHFFHYIKYAVLFYRHDAEAMMSGWEHRLFGIGFARPQTLLNGKEPFVTPKGPGKDATTNTPFLWQAPNSDAMLVIGKKWQEMHNYVSLLLERQAAAGDTPAFLAKKEVGEQSPAWLEYLLQMSRLRGYFTLYPSPEVSDAILGAHKDLYHTPEEYQPDKGAAAEGDTKTSYRVTQYAETFDPWSAVDLLTLLPNKGKLPKLNHMPLMSWDGKRSSADELEQWATEYAKTFRQEVGACKGEELERMPNWDASDLFCEAAKAAAA